MVNVARLFKKRATPSPLKIESMPSLLSQIMKLPNEKLGEIFFDLGSKRLAKITKLVATTEARLEREREALKAKFKGPTEKRTKIHNAIEETIAKIRKLPAETLTTEGIKQVKVLHNLLAQMEGSDEEFKTLNQNSNVTYSYKTSDLPLNDINQMLHFIGLIRANKIFRKTREKR